VGPRHDERQTERKPRTGAHVGGFLRSSLLVAVLGCQTSPVGEEVVRSVTIEGPAAEPATATVPLAPPQCLFRWREFLTAPDSVELLHLRSREMPPFPSAEEIRLRPQPRPPLSDDYVILARAPVTDRRAELLAALEADMCRLPEPYEDSGFNPTIGLVLMRGGHYVTIIAGDQYHEMLARSSLDAGRVVYIRPLGAKSRTLMRSIVRDLGSP
jgi:hypothetical protein